jgi:hypothetical protein
VTKLLTFARWQAVAVAVVGVAAAAEEGEMEEEEAAAVAVAEAEEVVDEDVSTVHFLLTITSSHSLFAYLLPGASC